MATTKRSSTGKPKPPKSRASRPWFQMTARELAASKAAAEKERVAHVEKTLGSKNPRAAIAAEVKTYPARRRALIKATITPAGEAALDALEKEFDHDIRTVQTPFIVLNWLRVINDTEVAYLAKGIGIRLQHGARR